MKIGILTMYYQKNYGGILQAYALMKAIELIGYDVEHIDFHYDPGKNIHPFVKLRNVVVGLSNIIRHNQSIIAAVSQKELPMEHINAFTQFKQNYLRYSKEVHNHNIHEIINEYDCLIVGSDQIWNNVSGNKLHYFLDFKTKFMGKRVAYAPCTVYTDIPWYNRNKLRLLFNKFDSISVRDNTTYKLVNTISGLKPKIVLDPTCLYDFREFSETKPIINEDYIFAYILGSELKGGHQCIIKKICQRYGQMKVVAAIIPDICTDVEKFADRVMYNASPSEWVNLVAHCKFVYTDSFHGCMFAMKFHKPFFAYYRDAIRSSRLLDIKMAYNLKNIFPSGDEYQIIDVDYTSIDRILNKQKEYSIEFLKSSLSKI